MRKRDYHQIDPQIEPLVNIFNQCGLMTYASCQGHGWPIDDVKPYISFKSEIKHTARLAKLLRDDSESSHPRLNWGGITGHFNQDFELCFRFAPEGAHRYRAKYFRSTFIHDFTVIARWITSNQRLISLNQTPQKATEKQ
ncbi:hypothetical protein [Providencia rustigianii]|uniref:hypothetical protein n=1 Tax=Providencia rustigianii TaxID=158850 RepID=UPI0038B41016